MVTFDEALNIIIPPIIFIGIAFLFYRGLKDPIDKFFIMIKGWIDYFRHRGEVPEEELPTSLDWPE